MKWQVLLDGEPVCATTDWLPVAAAAFNRASRDRNIGIHGDEFTLLKNGREIFRSVPDPGQGHAWPDGQEPTINDAGAALLQLIRHCGISMPDLLSAMENQGLQTTRSKLDSIKGQIGSGKFRQINPAELIVICYAAISALETTE